ncbi:MAG: ABC transporter substrate-binding protein [Actinobacteria bacterium]|nr:ABC transporter substrate-binding protein [Actinomycetota bacterium]
MIKHRRALAAVGAGVLATVLVAACSSSKKSTDTGTGSSNASGSSSGTAPSGPALKVMTIVPLSGNGVVYPQESAGAQATVKWVNANGGVAGHPLDLEVCDDQNSPNGAAACGQKAVDDKVVAVVGSFSLYGNSFMTALTSASIPYIGPCCPFASQEVASPNSFIFSAGSLISVGEGIAAGQVNGKTGTVVAVETASPATDYSNKLIQAGLKSTGFTGTFKPITVSAQATDYAPTVAQATNGSSTIIVGLGQQQAQAFFPALASAGGKQHIIGIGGNSLASSVVKANADATNGATVVDYYPPLQSSDKWKPFIDAFAKYASSDQKNLDISLLGAETTWIGFKVMKQVGDKMSGDITASAFLATLQKSTSVDTGGLTPPLDLSKPFSAKSLSSLYNTSLTFEKVDNGKITWPDSKFIDAGPAFLQYVGG